MVVIDGMPWLTQCHPDIGRQVFQQKAQGELAATTCAQWSPWFSSESLRGVILYDPGSIGMSEIIPQSLTGRTGNYLPKHIRPW